MALCVFVAFCRAQQAVWYGHGDASCGETVDGANWVEGTTQKTVTVESAALCQAQCEATPECMEQPTPRVNYRASSQSCSVYTQPARVNYFCDNGYQVYSLLDDPGFIVVDHAHPSVSLADPARVT